MDEEKLWMDCPKEERKAVNTIARCYRYFKGGYESGKYTMKEWKFLKSKCLYALDLCERYYSKEETDQRDYSNWKDSMQMYDKVREKL